MAAGPEFQVGHDCDAWCGKCKANTAHRVVAMITTTAPHQVACLSCNDWHRYGKPRSAAAQVPDVPQTKGPAAKVLRGKRADRRASGASMEESWRQAMEEAEGEPRVYDHRDTFAPGDVVAHPNFGLGIVTGSEGPGRALALFRGGREAFMMNGGRRR